MSSDTSWPEATLGQAVREVRTGPFGSMLHEDDYVRGGIPIVNPINILATGIFPDPDKTVLRDKARELEGFLLEADDVVVARRGEMGRCARVTSDQAGWLCGTGCFVVRPGPKMDGRFLAYLLGSGSAKSALESLASGVTMLNLGNRALQGLIVPMPPIDEQRRIAEVLRAVDEAIEAKQAALAASKRFKRTCREAAVARFEHHTPSRLQSVLTTIDAGWSPECESEPANDGEWSILKTSAVAWEGYDDEENKRLPAHLEPRPHLEVVPDDILITRAGPAERTGVIAIVRDTAGRRMLSDKIIRLRVDRNRAVPLAIAELLSSDHVQGELIRSKSGMAASQTNISQKIVLGLEMHLPPLSEQRDFADEMAALQDVIEASEMDLQRAQALKAALMSDLLSGRVRVPA